MKKIYRGANTKFTYLLGTKKICQALKTKLFYQRVNAKKKIIREQTTDLGIYYGSITYW